LIARAQKINAFAPDLVIIMHYNAGYTPWELRGHNPITTLDFNLIFIPGSFCAYELSRVEDRYEFLRLLLSEDIDHSLSLAQHIATAYTNTLGIPLADQSIFLGSYGPNSVFQEPGIFARNLALTRLVHAPLCYGETLMQNNLAEALLLSRNDNEVQGFPCPSRVKEVARAYFDGIKRYLEG